MSDMIRITIDGTPVEARKGETILNAAARAGIEIPNLCYMESLLPYGACGMCVVETNVSPKLLRACSAVVSDGMEVTVNSPRALAARKLALELIMGDHDADCVAPCVLNCPAHTNCQKYIKQIAEGDDRAALDTIREKIVLPASIGRVCPHPCETACRRQHCEEPISICYLKAFAADKVYAAGLPVPELAPATGKRVAIIGAGPAGLTAAYRLAEKGHAVTVYDKMPKAGGMLRYGIPEYRLPKAVLDKEIAVIEAMGVKLVLGCEIGKDITFDEIRANADAVVAANGAWKSSALRCPGEDLEGVFGGIDFLREAAFGNKPAIGKRTAIVGGGNTAMDACRTAVRLGAEEVSVIYRRTRAEMPAEDVEIREAEEEGVVFRFLCNPAEILGENGKVIGARLQVMALGEPDERGRRRPVPVEGKFVELALDSVIIAVGQRNDPAGFEALPKTERGTIAADERFGYTELEGVFACGDNCGKGAGIAVEAIAEANAAAEAVDAFLAGKKLAYREPVTSKRDAEGIDFSGYEKKSRAVMPQRAPEERRCDFREINRGFADSQARAEASRCLECGCHDYGECRLIGYADAYDIDCGKYAGDFHPGFTEKKLGVIERNQNKCILCDLCVRTCELEAKKGILGLVGRGFTTVIKPEFDGADVASICKDCLKCANACPTGALKITI